MTGEGDRPSAGWPAHVSQQRPWRNRGSREDRMLSSVCTAVPPLIAEASIDLPASVQVQCEAALMAVTRLDGHDTSGIQDFLIRNDSISSSKIEFIQADSTEYARALVGVKSNSAAIEMVHASDAMVSLVAAAAEGIRLEDILQAHRRLMADDTLDGPYAGRLRDVQNWIGGSDFSPIGAVHVPPAPEHVPRLMDDLVRFCNRDDMPVIAQMAIAHAQFESIHPFTDGNGRLGRALLGAILRRRGVTTRTTPPVASAFAARRQHYFDLVNAYRTGEVLPFIEYLAEATTLAAQEAGISAERLRRMPMEWRERTACRRRGALWRLIDTLAISPVIDAETAEAVTGVSASNTYAAIDRLEEAGVIHQITNRKRNRVWAALDVLDELDGLSTRITERALRVS